MSLARKIIVYITIFFASMASASIFGISLTKIAFIPLLIMLLFDSFGSVIKVDKKSFIFIGFYVSIILSSLYGLCLTNNYVYDSYQYKLTYNIIQYSLIYIPVVLLLFNNSKKQEYCTNIKNGLIWLARISCIFGLLQFLFWSFGKIDLNEKIFTDFFNGFFGDIRSARYQVLVNDKWDISLRISGFSHEPAIFCMIMLIGIIFDNKKIIKVLYTVLIVLSLSRAGIIALLIILFIIFLKHLKSISKKIIIQSFALLIAFIIFILFVYNFESFSPLRIQFDKMLERFDLVSNSQENVGTYRHINYIGWSLDSWASDLNIFQKIFGVGSRVSGIVFSQNSNYAAYLEDEMTNSAWAIESDFADILLGTGLVGVCFYVYVWGTVLKNGNYKEKLLAISFISFGLFYNVSIWTLSMIIMIFAVLNVDVKIKQECGDCCENIGYRSKGPIRL